MKKNCANAIIEKYSRIGTPKTEKTVEEKIIQVDKKVRDTAMVITLLLAVISVMVASVGFVLLTGIAGSGSTGIVILGIFLTLIGMVAFVGTPISFRYIKGFFEKMHKDEIAQLAHWLQKGVKPASKEEE